MGLCNLPLLDKEIELRKKNAEIYLTELSTVKNITLPTFSSNVAYNYIYFPILINQPKYRDNVFNYLKEKGINAKKYFYPLVTEYACYKGMFKDELPHSNEIANKVLCLPIYGELSIDEISIIIDELKNALV